MPRLSSLALVISALLGCAPRTASPPTPLMPNHDESSSALIQGLVREDGQGPFVGGTTETFRAVYDATQAASVEWWTSAGVLRASGDRAVWELPATGTVELTFTVRRPSGERISASWNLQLRGPEAVRSASEALLATPMPVIDGGTLEVYGGACDLQYDGAGNVHLVFTSAVHPGVYYGKWNGSTWALEFIDGMGFNTGGQVNYGRISLAVDSTNTPHIAYVLNTNQVWYATKSGASWIRERVDGTVPSNGGNGPSLALNPAASGQPTIAYTTTVNYDRLAIARRTGVNTWSNTTYLFTTSSSTYYQQLFGDLAIDSAGVLYAPMSLNGDGTYLAAVATSGTTSVKYAGNISTQRASLAWAGASRLLVRGSAGVYDFALASPVSSSTLTYSPEETSGTNIGDIAWGGGKPTLLHQHGSALELVTTNAGGFWTYTQIGTTSGYSAALALHPTSAVPSVCYQESGRIMFQ